MMGFVVLAPTRTPEQSQPIMRTRPANTLVAGEQL